MISGRMVRMRNIRYLIGDQYDAENVAEDLKLQLEVNRLNHVGIFPVSARNEVIVQIPEDNNTLEEVLGSFMESYKTGEILE